MGNEPSGNECTLAAMLVGAALLACGGVSSEPVRGPSGRTAYTIECKRPADCYAEAGELCPNGYEIVDSGSHVEHDHWREAADAYNASIQKRPQQQFFVSKSSALVQCTDRETERPEQKAPLAPAPAPTLPQPAPGPAPTLAAASPEQCDRASRTGAYTFTFERASGDCVEPGPARIDMKSGHIAAPPGCTLEETWSPDGCTQRRKLDCPDMNGARMRGMEILNQTTIDGRVLTGGTALTFEGADWSCTGHYRITAVRQSREPTSDYGL